MEPDARGISIDPENGLALLIGFISSLVGAYNPWPAVYEGASTRDAAIEQKVRNPFAANLLCWSFERDPDSWLTHYMAEGVFDPTVSRAWLPLAFTNMKRADLVEKARASGTLSKEAEKIIKEIENGN